MFPWNKSSFDQDPHFKRQGKDKGETTKKKVKKYKPKAKVEAPTFEDELKESKYTPSDKARMGIIKVHVCGKFKDIFGTYLHNSFSRSLSHYFCKGGGTLEDLA